VLPVAFLEIEDARPTDPADEGGAGEMGIGAELWADIV
jgi:hypothetical protein